MNQIQPSIEKKDLSLSYSPLLLVVGAAVLWSTGGLFIKATQLSALELSFGRSLLAAITIAIFTRREGFGINKISAITSILYAALIILFVLATKLTTAANAIFLQYTAPIYVLILEPIFYKEKFRGRDFITVALCVGGAVSDGGRALASGIRAAYSGNWGGVEAWSERSGCRLAIGK